MHQHQTLSASKRTGYLFHNVCGGDTGTAPNLDNNGHIPSLLYWMQSWETQAKRFIPTIHAVEGLDCIASCTFHQVIQCRHHYDSLLVGVKLKTHIAVVAASENLWFGIAVRATALLDNAYEWLVLVAVAIKPPQCSLVQRLFDKDMGRDQYAAHQFNGCC